jgi:transcriptional regulator of aromatic amino acid metabolism
LVAGSPAKIIKENIPQPLQEEEKKKIINDIFAAFIQHLNHHDFITEQKTITSGFELSIKNKNTHAEVVFCEMMKEASSAKTTNTILVLNKGTAALNANYIMCISLESNTRIGTSDVGEELVQFFSRYGVRFNRLD